MGELKKVARGKGAFTDYVDRVTTNHKCDEESSTHEGVWQVTVEGLPVAYHTAKIREHEMLTPVANGPPHFKCLPHAPTIVATCKSVLVGTSEGVLRPIAREDDITVPDTAPGSNKYGCEDIVGPIKQSSVWVGV